MMFIIKNLKHCCFIKLTTVIDVQRFIIFVHTSTLDAAIESEKLVSHGQTSFDITLSKRDVGNAGFRSIEVTVI